MEDRAPTRSVLLFVLLVALAPAVGVITVSAAPVANDQYAVAQGTVCTVVEPVTNESQNATEFYDYRNPNPDITGNPASNTYSSFGTRDQQQTATSVLFFYEGSESGNLVIVNDRLGDEDGGSTLTMTFDGLPADGEWVVEDDEYPNRDDEWVIGETTTSVDWKWADNRTDGGVYSGLGNHSGTVTITPAFNEEADAWGEWNYSGSDDYRVEAWKLLDADGSERELDRDRQVFIHGGGCEVTPPSASLTGPSSAEAGTSITLDASDTTDDDTLGGYEWDFDGDGQIEAVTTEPTTEHAFDEAGNYTVTVTAFDTYGNGDTAELSVNVSQASSPPNASLAAPAETTVNQSITFDASGSSDEGTITGYEWDFDGDGTVDAETAEPTIEHTYNETGDFTASVTVVDDDNETDTASATVAVSAPNQPPNASLAAPDAVDEGESVTLDASNSTDDRGIAEYRWDVDSDGTVDYTTTDPVLAHTYEDPGNATATVVVVDSDGVTDNANAMITVRDVDDPPTAALDAPAEATVNQSVTLDASASTDDGAIVEYRWDVDGDGTIDRNTTEPTTEYTYNETGEYSPSVTVVDSANQTATATTAIAVVEPDDSPNARLAAPENATVNQSVTLDASASTDDGTIVQYRWDVDGDGTVDVNTTEPTTEYTYTATGVFEASVTVVDDDNETDTASATIEVVEAQEQLSAALDLPAQVTVNESVTLDASGSTGENIETYRWDFDNDGTIDAETEEPTVNYTFTDAGTQTVRVVVNSDDDRTAEATAQVQVGDPAAASAEITVDSAETTAGQSVSFDASSSTAASGIGTYNWDFGDGSTASGGAVAHAYDSEGSYEVSVTITTTGGITTSATTTVSVQAADDGGNDAGGGGNDAGGANTGGGGDSGTSGNSRSNQADETDTETETETGEPDIGPANVSLSSQRLLVGETLVVEATVRNNGTAPGTKNVEFEIEGEMVEERQIPLAPGESRTVTFSYQFDTPGNRTVEVDRGEKLQIAVEPRKPDIDVTSLTVDKSEVSTGEAFTVTAVLENDGDADGSREVTFELFGETVASETVSVPMGESAQVTLTREILTAGSYEIRVGNASVTVTVVDNGTPTETSTGTSTDVMAPGFGWVTAVLALLVLTAVARRRRA